MTHPSVRHTFWPKLRPLFTDPLPDSRFVHFLLLSHHRSGSNFLTDVLQRHSAISVIDEPLSMHTSFYPTSDLVRWTHDEFDETTLHADLEAAPGARDFTHDLFSYLRSADDNRAKGFKETLMFEKLPWLRAALPDIRVVLLVRDPRAVVHSILSHAGRKQWGYDHVVPRYVRSYAPSFAVPLTDELDRCIGSWKIRYHEARAHIARFDHVLVRLEDFVRDPRRELPGIMALLGHAVEEEQLAFVRHSHSESRGGTYSSFRAIDDVLSAWTRGLSVPVRSRIENALNEEMHALGYC